jgi:DNA invertase Pin-like site-specific DNA recombinase
MAIIGYVRVSTQQQDLESQKLAIHEYARNQKLIVDQFLEVQVSSRKSTRARRIDELFELLSEGDTLVVSELSRLGRSVGEIVMMADKLVKKHVRFVAIKENILLNGKKQDISTKVMLTMFSLFAEIERDLISERTKLGLAAARARGKKLGRPKGSLSKSKLDDRKQEIEKFLSFGVSKSAIARMMDVSRGTLLSFIGSRKIKA